MVGDDAPPGSNTAEVFKDQLEQLGFQVDYQKVDHSTMITRFCGVPKNEPAVCSNFGWLKDFQDPQSMLQNTFSGDAIVESNNSNWPLLDDPAVNKAIHDAVYVDDPAERAEAWGEVDDMVMEQAVAVPWVWDNQSNIQSADVNGVINLFNANWDLSFTSLGPIGVLLDPREVTGRSERPVVYLGPPRSVRASSTANDSVVLLK